MKIYVNEKHEIKAINESTDETLTMHDVDRVQVFGNMSDYMILNYCYKVDDNGYSIYPSRNYSDIVEEDYRNKVDEQQNKISILEGSQTSQDNEIVNNMLATSELFELVLTMNSPTVQRVNVFRSNSQVGLVNIYVSLVQKGLKTIDEVPEVIREYVKKSL